MSRSAMKVNLTGLFVVLAAALCVTSAGVAASNPTPAPEPGPFTPVVVPLGISNQPTTVVVQLAGDPVTVVDADSATPLTDGQKQQLRSQLKSKQAPVAQQVQSLGGQVLASYQSSYNGLKVRIRARQARSLASLPGVVAVHPLQLMEPSNVHAIPLVGAPQVWDGLAGLHGEGIKIGVIDTGIDYTHADFAGPGTAAAYQTALAQDTADPTLTTVCMTPALAPCFGPAAPKVKGGVDLVGDTYNADPTSGSYQPGARSRTRTRSTATATARTSPAPRRASASSLTGRRTPARTTRPRSRATLERRPGRRAQGRPLRDQGLRLRGLDRRLDRRDRVGGQPRHGRDQHVARLAVRQRRRPGAEAADERGEGRRDRRRLAGNEGSNPYITSSPGTGTGAISVAANDPTPGEPGRERSRSRTGTTLQAINANGATFSDGTTLPVKVLFSSPSVDQHSAAARPTYDRTSPGSSS